MKNNFHHAKLRGADFRGKNLVGIDFSHADIRGADFSDALLVGAKFNNIQAGLPIFWAIGLVIVSLILAIFAGLISAYSGAFIGDLLTNNIYGHSFFGVLSLTTLAIFLIVIFWQGLGAAMATLVEVLAACIIAVMAFLPINETGHNLAVATQFMGLALAGSIAAIVHLAVAVAIVKVIALPKLVVITGFMAFIGVLLGSVLGISLDNSVPITDGFIIFSATICGLVSLAVIASGIYVGWHAIAGDKKYSLMRSLAIRIVAQRGTSFRGANLTDADFTQATLKSVDFRKSTLNRTCWFGVQKLEQARIEGTYLENPKVRQLVITKNGQGQNFDCLNLRGLNLKDSNLQYASFIGTDLSVATLENTNLSGAKLAQAQLYQANLMRACLTGAYIQNWGISTDTQLDSVKCEYVYMRLPTEDDPEPWRKPDNRQETFKEGDFADFITPIIKTLDLYNIQHIDPRQVAIKFKTLDLFHHESINPTAAAIAVTQLAQKYPEAELEIVALEGRGKENIRLQAIVTDDSNTSQLSSEYSKIYSQIKSLAYSDLQVILLRIQEKDERIRSLEKLLENAIHQPKFYVETYQSQGDTIMSQSKGNVNISGTEGNISGVAAAGENLSMTGVAIGEISGNVTNTINQLPDSSEPDKLGIKELLTELQAAIEADTSLSDEDKGEALEQLKAIAEAGKKPEDGVMQKMAKTALRLLKGIISELPSTVKLVEICGNTLPHVAKFFGLP